MSLQITFTDEGWDDYVYWQEHDKKLLKRINLLIKDASRDPLHGIGKPELLRGELSGFYSRRIDDKHRLIYLATPDQLRISACRYHYGDK
jgi:toxin YoeB